MVATKPDLDTRENIAYFVDRFYERLLKDERLAPIFIDTAAVDLEVHLPHIKDYWCKLLLGEVAYRRHTMNIHRRLHGRRPLHSSDFQRWLAFFHTTVDEVACGDQAERAKRIASAIAVNMEKRLKATSNE
ncbi:MAG: group III truncated hemoglobin [Pseudomonadota bacterium]